jgi:hypothetical protein
MRVAWEYARKRPVGVEINSSVLKLDVLVLVNLSQTLSLAKHRKTQQMHLRSLPIRCKTMHNEAKRSKCTQGRRQFTAKRQKNDAKRSESGL